MSESLTINVPNVGETAAEAANNLHENFVKLLKTGMDVDDAGRCLGMDANKRSRHFTRIQKAGELARIMGDCARKVSFTLSCLPKPIQNDLRNRFGNELVDKWALTIESAEGGITPKWLNFRALLHQHSVDNTSNAGQH